MRLYIADISGFSQLPGLDLLDPDRRERLDRYNIVEDKQRCLVAGLMLRYVFGAAAGQIRCGDNGKPYLPSGPYFNISHSGSYVVLGVSEHELGVDIEKIAEYKERLAKRCCTDDEMLWLENHDKDDFFKLWTGKESIMKAEGLGLSMKSASFSVLPPEDGCHFVSAKAWYLNWFSLEGYYLCCASSKELMPRLIYLDRNILLQ